MTIFRADKAAIQGFRAGVASALLATTMLAAGAIVVPGTAHAQAAQSYDIPAGPLAVVVNRFAEVSNIKLFYDSSLTSGLSSPGLKGSYAPAEGLSRILTGSGITFRQTGPRAFTLERAPQSADGAIQLGPVRVEGEGSSVGGYSSITSDPLASEGLPSYAAKASASVLRLPLSLRRTPQSVTVITRQQIEQQNLQTIASILDQTPGIITNRDNSEGYSFYSRGFQVESFQFDGVPSLSTAGGNVRDNYSMADSVIYDRIEVLKGATGLVSGSGYPSGVINFIRKRPTRELQVQGMLGAGSWDNYRAELDLGGPLTTNGAVRARIVAAYQDQDSFIEYFGVKQKTFYGIIEADLGPSTILSIGADYQDNDANGTTNAHLPAFYSDGTMATFARGTNAADRWAYRDQTTWRAFATLTHNFGSDWELKANATYRKYSSREVIAGMTNSVIDVASGSVSHGFYTGGASIFNTDTKEKGADLQLSGPITLFGRQHALVFGYNHASTNAESRRSDGDTDSVIPDAFNWDNNATEPSFYEWWSLFDVKSRQHIAYASAVLNPTDRLSIILGGRLNWYKWSQDNSFANGRTAAFSSEVSGRPIPYVGITYDLDSQHTVYASYTDIFRPQAYNFDRDGRPIDPLTGKNYEVGVKGEYLDGRLNASLAGFWIAQDNVSALDPTGATTPTGGTAYIAVKGVTTKGFEAELVGELLPGWQVHGGYTYIQSRDREDNRVSPIQPEHLFKLATSYRLPGALDGLVVGGNLYWQAGTYFETTVAGSTARFTQPSYALVGMTGSYDINENLKVSLSVNNLFDKHYYSGIGNYNTVYYGSPRNFFVSLRGRF